VAGILVIIAQAPIQGRAGSSADPHYTDVGMFDVHYCNWSDRPKFFKVFFSTERFAEIAMVETYFPDGTLLGRLDLDKYRILDRKGKPAKRVFITDFVAGAHATNGWYTAKIKTIAGATYQAKDFVYLMTMGLAENVSPRNKSENIAVPKRLSWDPIPGAKFYKVFIWDLWGDGRVILDSGLLPKPYVDLPPGLIKKGGWYRWSIHARDVNEHVLLGDFNHGSNLVGLEFTTAD